MVYTPDQLKQFTLFFGLGDWSDYDPSDAYETGQTREIKKVYIHPKYEKPKKYYDIAVLEVNEDLAYTTSIQPICLPLEPSDDWDNRANKAAIKLSGFGLTSKYVKHVAS